MRDSLYDYQRQLVEMFSKNQGAYAKRANTSKPWDSTHGPKPGSGTHRYSPYPDCSTLPAKRWVALRKNNLPDNYRSEAHDIRPWARDHRIKYRLCWVVINGENAQVFVFKKTRDALIFKLTWG